LIKTFFRWQNSVPMNASLRAFTTDFVTKMLDMDFLRLP